MNVIEKEAFKAVGIEVTADWRGLHIEMPATWRIFEERVNEIRHRVSDKMMDISLHVEDGVYTQMICVEVTQFAAEVPEGMVQRDIPKQKYIHHYHEGTLQEIAQSFGDIYRWAKEHEYQADQFKLDIGYLQNGAEKGHDLYVRIAE